ncbi:MAG: hypothetical protein AAF664_08415 [Planctomycetota bacterium]
MMSAADELETKHRYELQDRYLQLTRFELPAKARQSGWELTEDHCFMRVILDQLFKACWYDHLDRRLTAYKQLTEDQLHRCIEMAEKILEGDVDSLQRWNTQSLQWRGKLN